MRTRSLLSLTSLALVAACATPVARVAPPPVVATIAPPPPQMPVGGYIGMAIPPKRVDGRYVTPNIEMTAAATVWHLRGALNVAALTCDVGAGPYVTAYNSWIRNRKAVLDVQLRQYTREWENTGWSDWRAAYDNQQTRLYNFYTQPAMKTAFCAAALTEIRAVEAVPDAELPAFARAALARLDQPFVDFFAAYDRFADYYAGAVKPAPPPVVATIVAPPVAVATTMQPPESAAGGGEPAAPPKLAVAPEVLDRP